MLTSHCYSAPVNTPFCPILALDCDLDQLGIQIRLYRNAASRTNNTHIDIPCKRLRHAFHRACCCSSKQQYCCCCWPEQHTASPLQCTCQTPSAEQVTQIYMQRAYVSATSSQLCSQSVSNSASQHTADASSSCATAAAPASMPVATAKASLKDGTDLSSSRRSSSSRCTARSRQQLMVHASGASHSSCADGVQHGPHMLECGNPANGSGIRLASNSPGKHTCGNCHPIPRTASPVSMPRPSAAARCAAQQDNVYHNLLAASLCSSLAPATNTAECARLLQPANTMPTAGLHAGVHVVVFRA